MRIPLPGRWALVSVLVVVTAAACGGSGSSASSGVTVTTTVTQTATETGRSTGGTTTAAPCAAGDFLPVLKGAMDGSAPDLTIVKVKVTRCQNGYAFVLAVPDNSSCQQSGSCFDSAQVLLGWNGQTWNILNSGTDIGCTSIPLSDQTLVACKALGYPILTSTSFQMPSRNIYCLLSSTELRCDIQSGLKPPPAKQCPVPAGDWTGATISSHGVAKPNCASDSVGMPDEPTLDYGSVWGSGGITCLSDESGLQCANTAGHSFFLSRQGWAAS
jgi:hypothetical protein